MELYLQSVLQLKYYSFLYYWVSKNKANKMHLKEIQKNNHINQFGIIVTVVYQKNVGCVGRQV